MMMDAPAWLEIDLTAIADNTRKIKKISGEHTKLMAVVKADGYSLGAVPISKTVLANGADSLGVALFSEALELRKSGVTEPIVILGYLAPQQIDNAIAYRIIQTVYTYQMAEEISRRATALKQKAFVQIKIDSGMGRLGFTLNQQNIDKAAKIFGLPSLEVVGVVSHFAMAEEEDKSYSLQQKAIFDEFCRGLTQAGVSLPPRGIANSSAIVNLPDTHYETVRAGLALYGYYTAPNLEPLIKLTPSLSVRSRVSMVKEVLEGDRISYGGKWQAARQSLIATLQIGYADGISRYYADHGGEVLINGHRLPIVGNICMDQLMVDITDCPAVAMGDCAVLLGNDGDEQISLDEMAAKMGVINYEVLCRLGCRLPRIYYDK